MKKISGKNKVRITAIIIIPVFLICVIASLVVSTLTGPYHKSRELIRAIRRQDYEMVESMLKSGFDPNTPNTRITKLNGLFETAPDIPIDIAAGLGDLKSVELLLRYGANPNHIEGTGSYPLFAAVWNNGENVLEIVKLLVENGADPHELRGDDNVYFWIACRYSANDPEGEMRLKDVMDYLFTTFDEDAQSAKGNSIQIWSLTTTAIYLGKNVQLIRYLLDHGGKIDYNSSYSGQSFYDYCHEEGRESILSVIEENGGFPEDIED